MYDPWIHVSLTKLNMLRLDSYDSVLFLDADMLALSNPDPLFTIRPPAGICSHRALLKYRELDVRFHAELLPCQIIEDSLLTSYGIRGGLLLLQPGISEWGKLERALNSINSIGDNDLLVGPDEWFVSKLHFNDGWRHISNAFAQASWFAYKDGGYDVTKTVVAPKIVHFVSEKPWIGKGNPWPDY